MGGQIDKQRFFRIDHRFSYQTLSFRRASQQFGYSKSQKKRFFIIFFSTTAQEGGGRVKLTSKEFLGLTIDFLTKLFPLGGLLSNLDIRKAKKKTLFHNIFSRQQPKKGGEGQIDKQRFFRIDHRFSYQTLSFRRASQQFGYSKSQKKTLFHNIFSRQQPKKRGEGQIDKQGFFRIDHRFSY